MEQKKVIEVFGRYWHKNDSPMQLIEQYKLAGWHCLVFWEDEIDINTRDRIMQFTFPYEYDFEIEEVNKCA